MQLNPYESPRVPQPGQEQEPANSNSMLQLLAEIRDGQRELLQLQRDALKAQAAYKRYTPLMMLLPLLMFALIFGTSFYLRTSYLRPPTLPSAPRVVPASPATVPRPSPSVPSRGRTFTSPAGDNAAD